MKSLKLTVCNGEVSSGCRLDKFISEKLSLFSRSQVKSRVVNTIINGKKCKLSRQVHSGDELEIFYTDPPVTEVLPEKIKLNIPEILFTRYASRNTLHVKNGGINW